MGNIQRVVVPHCKLYDTTFSNVISKQVIQPMIKKEINGFIFIRILILNKNLYTKNHLLCI